MTHPQSPTPDTTPAYTPAATPYVPITDPTGIDDVATEPAMDTPTPASPSPLAATIFPLLKMIVIIIGAAMALTVWIGATQSTGDSTNYGSQISTIRAAKNLNDAAAQGAPQQSVVAGWATVDYLELVATQLDESAAQQNAQLRLHSDLLLIALLTGAGLLLASIVESLARRKAASTRTASHHQDNPSATQNLDAS
ncbi:hypothetical protein SAMN06309944_1772 [Micrococcales bacterium KH10]|nr:hypothetical protein SAMN06309944_1772 [Micrococcales bacterium KH10]